MPDVSKYNVQPITDARIFAQAQAASAEQAEIKRQNDEIEELNKLGISKEQLSYLSGKGVNQQRYEELRNSGYSQETIFYLADKGITTNFSKGGISALNKIMAGDRVSFSAGVWNSDKAMHEHYSNESVLWELNQVFNLPVGGVKTITFDKGQISTTQGSSRISSPREAAISQEIAEQNVAKKEGYVKAGIEEGKRVYQTPEGQRVTIDIPNSSISTTAGQERLNVTRQGDVSGINELLKVGDVPGALSMLGSSALTETQKKEVRGQISSGLIEFEKQANIDASTFYGFSGQFYDVDEMGKVTDTGLAGKIKAKPQEFGLSFSTVFDEYGGKTLTPQAWLDYKIPGMREKTEPIAISAFENKFVGPPTSMFETSKEVNINKLGEQSGRWPTNNPQGYYIYGELAKAEEETKQLGFLGSGTLISLFDATITDMKNRGYDYFGKTWEQQFKDYVSSPGEMQVPMTPEAVARGGRMVLTSEYFPMTSSEIANKPWTYLDSSSNNMKKVTGYSVVYPKEQYEAGLVTVNLVVKTKPIYETRYFSKEGKELKLGSFASFTYDQEQPYMGITSDKPPEEYTGKKSDIFEVKMLTQPGAPDKTLFTTAFHPMEKVVQYASTGRMVISDVIYGTAKAGLLTYKAAESIHGFGYGMGRTIRDFRDSGGWSIDTTPTEFKYGPPERNLHVDIPFSGINVSGKFNVDQQTISRGIDTLRASAEPALFLTTMYLLQQPISKSITVPALSGTGGLTGLTATKIGISINPAQVGTVLSVLGGYSEYERTGDIERGVTYGLGVGAMLKGFEGLSKLGRIATTKAESGTLSVLRNIFWSEKVVGKAEMLELRGLTKSQANEYMSLEAKATERSASPEELTRLNELVGKLKEDVNLNAKLSPEEIAESARRTKIMQDVIQKQDLGTNLQTIIKPAQLVGARVTGIENVRVNLGPSGKPGNVFVKTVGGTDVVLLLSEKGLSPEGRISAEVTPIGKEYLKNIGYKGGFGTELQQWVIKTTGIGKTYTKEAWVSQSYADFLNSQVSKGTPQAVPTLQKPPTIIEAGSAGKLASELTTTKPKTGSMLMQRTKVILAKGKDVKFMTVQKPAVKAGTSLENNLDFLSRLGMKLNTNLDVELGSQMDTKIGSKLESRLDTRLDTKLDTRLDTRLDTKLDSRLDTRLDTKLDLNIQQQLDTKMATKLETRLDIRTDTRITQRQAQKQEQKQANRLLIITPQSKKLPKKRREEPTKSRGVSPPRIAVRTAIPNLVDIGRSIAKYGSAKFPSLMKRPGLWKDELHVPTVEQLNKGFNIRSKKLPKGLSL